MGELKVRTWNDRCDMGMNDIRPGRDGHRAGWKDGWKGWCRADTGVGGVETRMEIGGRRERESGYM